MSEKRDEDSKILKRGEDSNGKSLRKEGTDKSKSQGRNSGQLKEESLKTRKEEEMKSQRALRRISSRKHRL